MVSGVHSSHFWEPRCRTEASNGRMKPLSSKGLWKPRPFFRGRSCAALGHQIPLMRGIFITYTSHCLTMKMERTHSPHSFRVTHTAFMVEGFNGYITVTSRPLLVFGGLMWFLRCVFTGTSRSLHGPGFSPQLLWRRIMEKKNLDGLLSTQF